MFEETGCAGVLIGRAAVVNPFIFRETRAFLETGEPPAPAPLEDRLEALRAYYRRLAGDEGERRAAFQIRKVLRMFGRAIGAGDVFHAAAGEVRDGAGINALLGTLRGRDDLARRPVRAIEVVPVPPAPVDAW
jgi:tRNA-dihydrouridine synthase B